MMADMLGTYGAVVEGRKLIKIDSKAKKICLPEYADSAIPEAVLLELKHSNAEELDISKADAGLTFDILWCLPKTLKILTLNIHNKECYRFVREKASGFSTKITHVNVTASCPSYSSIDGIIYSKDKRLLMLCPSGRAGHVHIPEGTKGIGSFAFQISHISSIELPKSLEAIGYANFVESGLTELTIPPNVKKIEPQAIPGIDIVHLPGGKPIKWLIDAVANVNFSASPEPRSQEKKPYAIIDMAGRRFAIPKDISADHVMPFRAAWDNLEFDEKEADTLFLGAMEPAARDESALAAYRANPENTEAKKYLKKHAARIASRLIHGGRDEELAGFLEAVPVGWDGLQAALNEANEAGNSGAAAYILKSMEGKAPGTGLGI